jgi:hypothetical protein
MNWWEMLGSGSSRAVCGDAENYQAGLLAWSDGAGDGRRLFAVAEITRSSLRQTPAAESAETSLARASSEPFLQHWLQNLS